MLRQSHVQAIPSYRKKPLLVITVIVTAAIRVTVTLIVIVIVVAVIVATVVVVRGGLILCGSVRGRSGTCDGLLLDPLRLLGLDINLDDADGTAGRVPRLAASNPSEGLVVVATSHDPAGVPASSLAAELGIGVGAVTEGRVIGVGIDEEGAVVEADVGARVGVAGL